MPFGGTSPFTCAKVCVTAMPHRHRKKTPKAENSFERGMQNDTTGEQVAMCCADAMIWGSSGFTVCSLPARLSRMKVANDSRPTSISRSVRWCSQHDANRQHPAHPISD
jgi:hypothetical protein